MSAESTRRDFRTDVAGELGRDLSENAEGVQDVSPGSPSSAHPGYRRDMNPNPEGVPHRGPKHAPCGTPLGYDSTSHLTQGAPKTATLG